MPGSISQLQMLYVPEEDRILFRVNTSERQQFRFWLTRRYSILLLKVLREHQASDPDVSMQDSREAKQAVQSFKQEQAMTSANFEEAFSEDPNELPLGEEIPVAFKLSYTANGGSLNVSIEPRQGQGISMAIDRSINMSLTALLVNAAGQGHWELASAAQNATRASQDNIVIN